MRLLHITHHAGCAREIEYVAHRLELGVETWFCDTNYNVSAGRADALWRERGAWINGFDIVLTSDTAPLARIVLQHMDEFRGGLVVWVCNRFDYADQATNDCGFPDPAWYDLFRTAAGNPRVRIASYTEFEHEYARRLRDVEIGRRCIKPTGCRLSASPESLVPPKIDAARTFFVPPYHNDTRFLDLEARCRAAGVPAWRGRYAGPDDLARFRGVVHVPYTWSTFAFFENMQTGLPQLLPSAAFLRELRRQHGNFFWSPPLVEDLLPLAEEYWSAHAGFLIYFDSWEDLATKAGDEALLSAARVRSRAYGAWHEGEMLRRWREVLL